MLLLGLKSMAEVSRNAFVSDFSEPCRDVASSVGDELGLRCL